MLMYNDYGELATAVYEITKPVGASLNGDIDYYSERLEGITGKILEAGVGSGRMLIPLLEEGFDMEGMDQSETMLKACQNNLTARHLKATLYQQDLVTADLAENFYEGIIMPTATFCLIQDEDAAFKVLENFYRALKPDGKLIVDLDLPFYPEMGETSTTNFEVSPTELITFEKKIIAIDWLEQHIVSHLIYAKWEHGVLVKQELQRFLLRWYGLNEFRLMLEKIGFKEIILSSDYEFGTSPVDSNQTITFEATK